MPMMAMKADREELHNRDRLRCTKISLRTVEENIQRFKSVNQSVNQQVAERQAEDLRNKITLIEKLLKTKRG
jgi:predicted transglutaminase-like cysteine proteinase